MKILRSASASGRGSGSASSSSVSWLVVLSLPRPPLDRCLVDVFVSAATTTTTGTIEPSRRHGRYLRFRSAARRRRAEWGEGMLLPPLRKSMPMPMSGPMPMSDPMPMPPPPPPPPTDGSYVETMDAGVVASVRRLGAADWEWERSCDETKCRNSVEGYSDFVPGYGGYSCWTPLVSDTEAAAADAKEKGDTDEKTEGERWTGSNLFSSSHAASASSSASASAESSLDLFASSTTTAMAMTMQTTKTAQSTKTAANAAATCADGLEAHVVLDLPTLDHDGVEYVWYTCCAPLLRSDGGGQYDDDGDDQHEHESDDDDDDDDNDDDESSPKRSAATAKYDALNLPNLTSPALRQTTPPRRRSSDLSCRIHGDDCWADAIMEPMTCDHATEFRYPRKTGADANAWGFWLSQYICCSEPGPTGSPVLEYALPLEALRLSLSAVAFMLCTLIMLGILSSANARRNAYNLYLVFLAAPDALYLGFNAVAGALALTGVHVKTYWVWGCQTFYMANNLYMNAVIAFQIYHLLLNSHHRKKTIPPTARKACLQAAAVCVWSALISASVAVLYSPLIYLTPGDIRTVWLVTTLIATVPPIGCFAFVCVRVHTGRLLPKSGHTRVLSLYYLRVILAFVVLWLPSTIVSIVSSAGLWTTSKKSENLIIVLLLMALQGIISSALALSKPDVREATWSLLRCRCIRDSGKVFMLNWWPSCTISSLGVEEMKETAVDTTATVTMREDEKAMSCRCVTPLAGVLRAQVSPTHFSENLTLVNPMTNQGASGAYDPSFKRGQQPF